jgi:hypothetical protein
VILIFLLLKNLAKIQMSVDGLLEIAGKVGANTANIPQLEATARAGADRRRGGRPGRLHERAHRRLRREVSMVFLSVVLGSVVILVLALALVEIRRRLVKINEGLATLGTALAGVEAEHLRPLEGAVKAINAQFDVILGALPEIARKAAIVAERRPR